MAIYLFPLKERETTVGTSSWRGELVILRLDFRCIKQCAIYRESTGPQGDPTEDTYRGNQPKRTSREL
jgi:hypothetical protein